MKPRAKCLPPIEMRLRLCDALEAVTDKTDRQRGVFALDVMNFVTGTPRWLGVAARRTDGKPKGRAVLFNVCPFCGEPITWWKAAQPDGTEKGTDEQAS